MTVVFLSVVCGMPKPDVFYIVAYTCLVVVCFVCWCTAVHTAVHGSSAQQQRRGLSPICTPAVVDEMRVVFPA